LNSSNTSEEDSNRIKLQDIDYLKSCGGQSVKTVVFGYLSQLKEGKYFLEDPTGILPLNLSEAVSIQRFISASG
jgi:DNA polymerase epsilon subunit 2